MKKKEEKVKEKKQIRKRMKQTMDMTCEERRKENYYSNNTLNLAMVKPLPDRGEGLELRPEIRVCERRKRRRERGK